MAWEERGKHGELATTLYAVGDGTEATHGLVGRTTSTAARVMSSTRRFSDLAAAPRLGMEAAWCRARLLWDGVAWGARHDMKTWRWWNFLGGGVCFGYDGGKGRHQQVGPTSQRGKKAGPGWQQGRAREALYADGPGGELGLRVEQACTAWLLGRIEGRGRESFPFLFCFQNQIQLWTKCKFK